MRLLIFCAIVCPILACATTAAISDADLTRGQGHFPGLTRERLEAGQRTYVARCGACHEAFAPGTYTAEQWHVEVDEMAERASLDPEQKQLVLEYLTTFAK